MDFSTLASASRSAVRTNTTEEYYTITTLSPAAIVVISVVGFALAVVFFIAYIKIISRAGYSGWWVLVMFVPVLNIVMLLIFAYREWPIQRELRELRGWANQIQRGPGPGYAAPPFGPPTGPPADPGAPPPGEPAGGQPGGGWT